MNCQISGMSFRSMISCPLTIEFAFGFEGTLCGIGIEISPDISFFRIVGNNGNEEVANVKHTFSNFESSRVEGREISTGDDMFIGENSIVIESNDAPEVFRFIDGDDGSIFIALNSVVPSHITHLVFGRIKSIGRNERGILNEFFSAFDDVN